jgi:hypothetical protein
MTILAATNHFGLSFHREEHEVWILGFDDWNLFVIYDFEFGILVVAGFYGYPTRNPHFFRNFLLTFPLSPDNLIISPARGGDDESFSNQ